MAIPTFTAGVSPSIVDLVGDTPLIRLRRIERDLPGVELYAKAEWQNPGGSVKDRPALRMIQEGVASGQLTPGKLILDATSGNTGIAYAMIGAAMDFKVTLCVPENVTPERKRILRAFGAEIIFTDPMQGSDGAILMCREIYEADPDRYFYPDQYNNPANWKAHFETTAVEIIDQTAGRITHFVAAMGTSGSFVGTSRRLKRDIAGVQCVSAQPSSGFHGLEGLKHMPTAIVPGIYDPSLADHNVWVETEEAYAMTRRIGREEGVLVGISTGANVTAARKLGKELAARGESGVIVTFLCDGAAKYLSEPFWNESE